MLASSLSGRDLRVESAKDGATPWTDGTAVFLDLTAPLATLLRQLCVQCALLASGSLEPEILRALNRKSRLASRYLAVEGHRALMTLDAVLPPAVRNLIDPALATRSDSPAASLEWARSADAIDAYPAEDFGAIRVRTLLAASGTDRPPAAAANPHMPRAEQQPLKELDDSAQADEQDGEDIVSSPVGGGGGIGRLLQRMFDQVRRLKDGGTPGADAPTHWSRSGSRGAARAVASTATAQTVDDAFGFGRGILYPEWDATRRAYRVDWCTVTEKDPPAEGHAAVEWLEGYGLRRPLARLGMGFDRVRRRKQGDDIDIDAAIEAQVDRLSGTIPDENAYIESLRTRRDLSVLILLDISGSSAQDSPAGRSVHEQQRRVAAALATVLYEIGDRIALYAFHSQGRAAVHLVPVKRFDEELDSRVMRRLHSLVPGAYSRLGAAIRHGATLVIERGGTARRLLLVLSDGLAYDHGYDAGYGSADARMALAEARRDGVGCLCLSLGTNTDTESLKRVFGSAAHANLPRPGQLGQHIGALLQSALKASEVRRKAA